MVIDGDGSGGDIVEAEEEAETGRFAASGFTNESGLSTGSDSEVYALEDGFVSGGAVGEDHVVE